MAFTQDVLTQVGDEGLGLSTQMASYIAAASTVLLVVAKSVHWVPENHAGVRLRLKNATRPSDSLADSTLERAGELLCRDSRVSATLGRYPRLSRLFERDERKREGELYGLGDRRFMLTLPFVESVIDVPYKDNSEDLEAIIVDSSDDKQLTVKASIDWGVKYSRETRDRDIRNPYLSLFKVNSGLTKLKNKDENKEAVNLKLANLVVNHASGALWLAMRTSPKPKTKEDKLAIEEKVISIIAPIVSEFGVEPRHVELQTATETPARVVADALRESIKDVAAGNEVAVPDSIKTIAIATVAAMQAAEELDVGHIGMNGNGNGNGNGKGHLHPVGDEPPAVA